MSHYSQFQNNPTFSTSSLDENPANPVNKSRQVQHHLRPSYSGAAIINNEVVESDDVEFPMPPKIQPKNEKTISQKKRKFQSKSKKNTPYINIKLTSDNLRNLSQNKHQGTLYFASIAPLKSDRIDVHTNNTKELELSYCAGLFMSIDKSFTIHTILSTEFITALKTIALKHENDDKCTNNKLNIHSDMDKQISSTNSSTNSNSLTTPIMTDEKIEEKKDESSLNSPSKDEKEVKTNIGAYHPSDQIGFSLMHKHIVIYIPGNNYSYDEFSAAELIMNESISFYCDMPYLVVPFIWPCEGELLDYDFKSMPEKACSKQLSQFIRRMWSLFERIDFVGHGKGCTILLRSLEQLLRDKSNVIDQSHVICVAPDIESKKFIKHVKSLKTAVKRITLYTNTWDWKLFSSKWWNWTDTRAGASILFEKGLDTIDTTEVLAGWFTSNHWYLTNKYFKNDIKQALSKEGGLRPKYRNYVLPIRTNNGLYYQLVDQGYVKPKPGDNHNPKNKKRQKNNSKNQNKMTKQMQQAGNVAVNMVKTAQHEIKKYDRQKSGYSELGTGMKHNSLTTPVSESTYSAPVNEMSETNKQELMIEKTLAQTGYLDVLGVEPIQDEDENENDRNNDDNQSDQDQIEVAIVR